MRIKVQLRPGPNGEVVEDWVAFRDVFVEAAEKLGLTIDQIIHVEGPL